MLTESYGGTCPNCGYDKMLVRHGRSGYYQYDACPNCAFALGEWYEQDKEGHWQPKSGRDYDTWSGILGEEERFPTEPDFVRSLTKYLLKIEELTDNKGEIESVFSYTHFDWEQK